MEPLQIEISCLQSQDKFSPRIEVLTPQTDGLDSRKPIEIPSESLKEFDTVEEAEKYGKSLVPELLDTGIEYVVKITPAVDATRAPSLPKIDIQIPETEYQVEDSDREKAILLLEYFGINEQNLKADLHRQWKAYGVLHEAANMPFKVEYGRALSHLDKARKILEEEPNSMLLIQPLIAHVEMMLESVKKVRRKGPKENPKQTKEKDRIKTRFLAIEAANKIYCALKKEKRIGEFGGIGYCGALLLHYLGFIEIAPRATSKNMDPAVNRFWKYKESKK